MRPEKNRGSKGWLGFVFACFQGDLGTDVSSALNALGSVHVLLTDPLLSGALCPLKASWIALWTRQLLQLQPLGLDFSQLEIYPCPNAVYLEAGKVALFISIWKHSLRKSVLRVKELRFLTIACILWGFMLNFPLCHQVRFQQLFFTLPQLLSWAAASLKTHDSTLPFIYLGGPLDSGGLDSALEWTQGYFSRFLSSYANI